MSRTYPVLLGEPGIVAIRIAHVVEVPGGWQIVSIPPHIPASTHIFESPLAAMNSYMLKGVFLGGSYADQEEDQNGTPDAAFTEWAEALDRDLEEQHRIAAQIDMDNHAGEDIDAAEYMLEDR